MADVTCEHPLNDRHGVMIVGDPMSAKTKAYMLLAETLTTMSERKIPEHHEFRVRNMSTQIPPCNDLGLIFTLATNLTTG